MKFRQLIFVLLQVVGNRGTIEINPRMMMVKESSIMGVLLFKSSKVSSTTLHLFHYYRIYVVVSNVDDGLVVVVISIGDDGMMMMIDV